MKTTTKQGHVILYCRLSPRPGGDYEGVDDQEKWGREWAEANHPDLAVVVYRDPGKSAAKEARPPNLERLLGDLREGKTGPGPVAALWAVEQSRLERGDKVRWFETVAILQESGIDEFHTKRSPGGPVRLGDLASDIIALVGINERSQTLERARDRIAEIAARGEPPGSKPFGYQHTERADGVRTYATVPEQAKVIVEAAEKVLAGWSLSAIAAEFTKRGVTGGHMVTVAVNGERWTTRKNPLDPAGDPVEPNGPKLLDEHGRPVKRPGKMTPAAIKKMVTNPSVAGKRVHQGEVIGNGNWEPILDQETWQACRSKLSQPRRVTKANGGSYPISEAHKGNATGRRYLLTAGLAVCGVCSAPMVGTMKQMRNSRGEVRLHRPYLICHPSKGGKGCTGIMLPETEEYVAKEMFAELEKPGFLNAAASDDHQERRESIVAALGGIERQGQELAAMWAAGDLSSPDWATARDGLTVREQGLRRDLAEVPPPVATIDVAEARATWDDGMPLDEKREFIRAAIERVTINRAKPGTRRFDDDRIDIEWRR